MDDVAHRATIRDDYGIAKGPARNDTWLNRAKQRALRALPPLSCTDGKPQDEGDEWAWRLTDCGNQLVPTDVNRVSRAVQGARLEFRRDQSTHQFTPLLVLPKQRPRWPGRVDHALAAFAVISLILFVGVRIRENTFG